PSLLRPGLKRHFRRWRASVERVVQVAAQLAASALPASSSAHPDRAPHPASSLHLFLRSRLPLFLSPRLFAFFFVVWFVLRFRLSDQLLMVLQRFVGGCVLGVVLMP